MKFLFLILLITIASLCETATPSKKKGKAPWIKLRDGREMPSFGLGTSGALFTNCQKAVEDAIDAGYRLIDTSEYYQNEEAIGKAIKNKIKEGVIERDDIFVLTKIWNDHHAREVVVPTLKEQLKRLDLDYVDLYLIHWPMEEFIITDYNRDDPVEEFMTKIFGEVKIGDTDYMDTWEGLIECQKLGLTKSIGVSNFSPKQLKRLSDNSTAEPAAIEIEVNPNLIQKKMVKFCQDNNLPVIAFAPLGSMPDDKRTKDSPPPALDDPILTKIGKKYNKTTVQVVLRYLVERGVIPIPKSVTKSRIYENIDIFDFTLTPEEKAKIEEFNTDLRLVDANMMKGHKFDPFDYDL